ncbi:hypothetical protein GYMLUDRAFT_34331 [Collybiopsis luxurians FD-317 M1]|nr:hypothetical protein GYMLUDRAFT_34331 [Collybiopsis luxurians FD-317 M1]
MDRLEALGNTLSQITMYDIKSYYEQAKNVVLNVSEIEAKVREATNDDPWGASSTLMQDIASRTFNYPEFNEIMPSIYSRFMEKEARQWRQIYKSLQLLEYLIKHGSERVVDDARAHISTIKMLRSFHYIDDKGKDQGLNVRNRAKEIVELLSDVETIRAERRKAKANKSKYTGTGSDGMSFSSGGSRYGGFGSDSLAYGGSSSFSSGDRYGGDYGGSSSYGGGSSSFRDASSRGFEEYNAGDDEDVSTSPTRRGGMNTSSSVSSARSPTARRPTAPEPAPAPVQEVDLLGGLDDTFSSNTTPQAPPGFSEKALPAVAQAPAQTSVGLDDDDFADFQAAPTMTTTTPPAAAAPSAPPTAPKMNLMEMLNSTPARPQSMSFTSSPPLQSQGFYNMGTGTGTGMGGMAAGGMHRPSPSLSSNSSFGGMAPMRPMSTSATGSTLSSSTTASPAASSKPASSSNFDDLWSMSLGSSKPSTPAGGANKSMKDIQNEKASAGLWGSGPAKPAMGSNAFGSFGSSVGATGSNSAGADDLLL